ncbi:uncharacterized protein [Branchiostoma lanceolatum]|uniref:uncharacterized protein isoform X2 n=1 Tax=Branchiostoma lanceolatum TaxID=7740 RepID=UPI0034571F14
MSFPEKEEYLVIEKGAAGDESSSRLGQRVVGEQVVVNEDGSRTVIRTVEETFEEEVEEEFHSSASSATSTDSSPALRTESFTERNEIEDADSGIENATPAKSARVTKKDSIKEYVAKKMVENHSTNEPPQSRQQHPSPIIGRTGKLYKRKRKEPCPYCEYTRQVLTMMGHDMDETEKLVLNVGKVKECLVQELANIEERQRLLKERIVYEERIRRQRRLQEQYQKLKKLKKRKRRRHMKPVEQPSPKKAVAIAMRVGPEQTENKQVGLYRLFKPPMPLTARPSKREESHPVHHELDMSKPHGPKCRSHHHTDLYPEDDGRYHCHGNVRIHRGDMYYTIPSKDLLFRSYAQEKEVDPVTIERIIDKIPQIRKQQGDHVIVLDEDILTFGNWEEIKSEVIIPHHVLRMDEAPAVPVEREGRVSPITLEMGTWDEVLNDVFHIAIDKEQVSRQPRYLQGQNLNAWASVEETDEVPRLQYQAAQINVVEQEVFNPQTEEIEVEEAEYLNGVLRSIYTNLEQVNGEFPGYCDSCAHAKLHDVMQEVFEAEMSQVVFEEPKYLEGEEGKAHVKLEEAKEELPPLPFHMLAYGQAVMDMYRPNAKKVRSESPRYLHSVEDLEFLHEEDFDEDSERFELERLMGEQVKQVLWEHSTGGLRSSSPEYLKALVSEGYVAEEGEDGRISPTPSLQSLVIGETLMDIFRAEAGAVDTEDPRYHQGIVSREYAAEEEIDGVLTQENFDKAAVELLRQESFKSKSGVRRSEHARYFAKENRSDLPEESTGKFSPVSFENALLGQVFVDQWKADLQTIEAETARYHHGIIQHGIVSGESIDGKVSPPPNPQNVVVGQALMDIFKANVEEVPLERPRYHATENELQQESTGKISPLSFDSPDFGEVFMKKWKAVMKQEEVRVPRYHHGILSDEYMGDEAIDGRISPRPTAQNLLVAQVLMETFKATSEQVRAEIPRYIAKEDQMSHNEESTGKVSPVSFESATLGEIFMERWRTNIDLVKASSPRYHHAVIGEEYLGREEADGRLSPQPTFKNLLSAKVLMETFRATSDKVRAEVPQHFAREGQTLSVDSTGTVSPVSFENATFGEICMEKVKAITKEEKAELPRYHHAFISDEFVGEEEIDGRISPRRTAENLLAAQVLMETFRATSEKVKAEVPRYTAREGHTSYREESTGTISPVSFESVALGEVFMEKWKTNLDEVKAQTPRYHHGYVMDEFVGEEEIDGRISPLPNVEKLLTAKVLLEAHKATSEQVRQEVPRYFATEGKTSQDSTGTISPVSFENAAFGDIVMKKFKAITKEQSTQVPRYLKAYVSDEFVGVEEIDGRISPRPTLDNLLTAQVLMETFKATSEQVREEVPRYTAQEGQTSERVESTGKVSPVSFEKADLGEIFMEQWKTNIDLVKASSPRYHQAIMSDEYVGEDRVDGRLSPEPTLQNLFAAQTLMETFRATSDQVRAEVPCLFATEGQASLTESAGRISPVSFESVSFDHVFMEEWRTNIDRVKAQTPRYHHAINSNEFMRREEVDGRISPQPTFKNLVTAQVLMETFRAASKEVREEVPRHIAMEGELSLNDESTGKVSPVSFERAALGEIVMNKWKAQLDLVRGSSPRYLHAILSDEYVGEEQVDGKLSPEPSYDNLVAAQTLMETFKATTKHVRAEAPRHFATEGRTSLPEESTGRISPVTLEGAMMGEILLQKMSADLSVIESWKPRYLQGVVSNEYLGSERIDGRLSPEPSPEKLILGEAFMDTFRATANEVREEVPRHWAREGHASLMEEDTGRVSPVAFEAASLGHIFMEKWKANLEKIQTEEARYHQAMVKEQLLWEERTEGEIPPNPNLQNLVLGQALMDTFRATEHHVKAQAPQYRATENYESLREGSTGRISPLSYESGVFGEIFLDKWKASLEQVVAEAPRFHQAIVKDQFIPEHSIGGKLSRAPSFRKAEMDQVAMDTYRANAMKVMAQLPQYQATVNQTSLEEGTTGKVSPVSFEKVTFGEILMDKWKANLEQVLTESPRYNQAIMKDQFIPEDRTDGQLSRAPSLRKADVDRITVHTFRANAEQVRAQAAQYQAAEHNESVEEGAIGKVSPVSFDSVRYGKIIMEKSKASLEQVTAENARYHQAIVKNNYIPEDTTDGKLSRAPSFRQASASKTTMTTLRAAAIKVKAQAPRHNATVNKSETREESMGRISPVSYQSSVSGQVVIQKLKANLELVQAEQPRYKHGIQKQQFLQEGHATATPPLPNFDTPVFQAVKQSLHRHQTNWERSEKPQYLQVQEQEARLHYEQEAELPPLTFHRSVHGQVMLNMHRARHEELELEMPRYHQPVQRQVHVNYEEVAEEIPIVNMEAVEYAPVEPAFFRAALDLVQPDMDLLEAELKKANSHPESYEDLPGFSTDRAKATPLEKADVLSADKGLQRSESPSYLKYVQNTAYVHESDVDDNISVVEFDSTQPELIPAERVQTIYINSPQVVTVPKKPVHEAKEVKLDEPKKTKGLRLPKVELDKAKPSVALGQLNKAKASTPKIEEPFQPMQMQKIEPARQMRSAPPANRAPRFKLKEKVMDLSLEETGELPKILKRAAKLGLIPKLPKQALSAEKIQSLMMDIKFAQELQEELREDNTSDVSELDMEMADLGFIDQTRFNTVDVFAAELLHLKLPKLEFYEERKDEVMVEEAFDLSPLVMKSAGEKSMPKELFLKVTAEKVVEADTEVAIDLPAVPQPMDRARQMTIAEEQKHKAALTETGTHQSLHKAKHGVIQVKEHGYKKVAPLVTQVAHVRSEPDEVFQQAQINEMVEIWVHAAPPKLHMGREAFLDVVENQATELEPLEPSTARQSTEDVKMEEAKVARSVIMNQGREGVEGMKEEAVPLVPPIPKAHTLKSSTVPTESMQTAEAGQVETELGLHGADETILNMISMEVISDLSPLPTEMAQGFDIPLEVYQKVTQQAQKQTYVYVPPPNLVTGKEGTMQTVEEEIKTIPSVPTETGRQSLEPEEHWEHVLLQWVKTEIQPYYAEEIVLETRHESSQEIPPVARGDSASVGSIPSERLETAQSQHIQTQLHPHFAREQVIATKQVSVQEIPHGPGRDSANVGAIPSHSMETVQTQHIKTQLHPYFAQEQIIDERQVTPGEIPPGPGTDLASVGSIPSEAMVTARSQHIRTQLHPYFAQEQVIDTKQVSAQEIPPGPGRDSANVGAIPSHSMETVQTQHIKTQLHPYFAQEQVIDERQVSPGEIPPGPGTESASVGSIPPEAMATAQSQHIRTQLHPYFAQEQVIDEKQEHVYLYTVVPQHTSSTAESTEVPVLRLQTVSADEFRSMLHPHFAEEGSMDTRHEYVYFIPPGAPQGAARIIRVPSANLGQARADRAQTELLPNFVTGEEGTMQTIEEKVHTISHVPTWESGRQSLEAEEHWEKALLQFVKTELQPYYAEEIVLETRHESSQEIPPVTRGDLADVGSIPSQTMETARSEHVRTQLHPHFAQEQVIDERQVSPGEIPPGPGTDSASVGSIPSEAMATARSQHIRTQLHPYFAQEQVVGTRQLSAQEIPPFTRGDSANVGSIPREAMVTALSQRIGTQLHPYFGQEQVIDEKQEYVYLYTIVPQHTAESSEVPVLRLQKVQADEFRSMLHPHYGEEGSVDTRYEYVYFIPPGAPKGEARLIQVPSAMLSQAQADRAQTELRPHYGRETNILEGLREGVSEFDGPRASVARGEALPHENYRNVVPAPQTQTWVHVPPPKMRHAKDSSLQTRDEVVYTIPPIPMPDHKVRMVPLERAQQERAMRQVIPTQTREMRMEIPEETVHGMPTVVAEQSARQQRVQSERYQKVEPPRTQTWIKAEPPKMVAAREGSMSDVVAEVVSAVAPIPTQAASEGIVPAEVMEKVHAAQRRMQQMPSERSMGEQVEIISTIPPLSSNAAKESLTPAGVFRQIHAQHVQSHKMHAGQETVLRDNLEIQREVPPLMPKTTMWRLLPQDKTPKLHRQQHDSHRSYSAAESHVSKSKLESVTELPDLRPKVAREVLLTHEDIHQAISRMQRSSKLRDPACEIQEAVAQLVENSDGSVAFKEGENLPSMPDCPFCDVQEGMIHFGPSYELKKLQTTQVFQVGDGPQLRNIYVRQVQDAQGEVPLEQTRRLPPTQRRVASTGTVISDEYQRADVDTLFSNWVPAELQVTGELESLMQQGIIRYNPLHSTVEEEEGDVYDYGDIFQSKQKSGRRRTQREGATVANIPNVGYPTKQWNSTRNMTRGQIEREGDESLDSELIMELTSGGLHQEKIVQKDGWTYIYIPGPPESPIMQRPRTTTKISYREDKPPFAFDFSRLMHWTVGRRNEVEKKARVPEEPHYIPFDFSRVATWTVHEYQPGSNIPVEKTYVSAALPVQVRNTYFVKGSPTMQEDAVRQSPRVTVPREDGAAPQVARSLPQETMDWTQARPAAPQASRLRPEEITNWTKANRPERKDFDFSRVQDWTVIKKETVGGNSAVGPDEMRISYLEDGKLKQRFYRRPQSSRGSSVLVGEHPPDLSGLKFLRSDDIPLPERDGRVQHSSAILPGEMYITYVENGEVKKLYMSKTGHSTPGEVVDATSRQAYFQPGSRQASEDDDDDDKSTSISGISGVGRPAMQFPSTHYERESSAAKPPSPTDDLDTPKTLEMTSGSRHEPSIPPDIQWTHANGTHEVVPLHREDHRPSQMIVKSGSRPSTPAESVSSRRSDRIITYKYDNGRSSDDVSLVVDASRPSSHSSTAAPIYVTSSHARPKSPTPDSMAQHSPRPVSHPPHQPSPSSPVAPPRRRRSSASSSGSSPYSRPPPSAMPTTTNPTISRPPEPMDMSGPAVSGRYINSYPERDYSQDREQPLTFADHDVREDEAGKPKKVGKLKKSRFFPFLKGDKKGKKTKGHTDETFAPVGVVEPTRENRDMLERLGYGA